MNRGSAIVTGGAGFIGSRLVERMIDHGWAVYVVDDFSTHTTPKWPDLLGVSISNGRVQDHSSYRFNANPPNLIVHLAGKVGPLGVMKFKGSIAKDTVDSAAQVATWALQYECPLIFISTSEVYGDASRENKETDLPVIQPASGRSEYAVAKLAAEHMLLNIDKLDVRIIRPFNIAGYGQRTEGGFVIPRFINQVSSDEPMTVYLPGTQQRSFTHVDDFIDGLGLVYTDGKSKEIYNVGNPNNKTSMFELAMQVGRMSENSSARLELIDPFELHGSSFKEAPDKIPDHTKMVKLGWKPRRDLEMIIKDSFRYARD